MADTGFNWDASWSAMQKSATDWTSDAIADAATETGDAVDMDNKASINISIAAYEDNTGAIDGDVTVHVLGDIDGTNYEEPNLGNTYAFSFTPVQNDTIYVQFTLYGSDWTKFKIAIENQGGQEIAFTVKYKYSTVPVAS